MMDPSEAENVARGRRTTVLHLFCRIIIIIIIINRFV